MVCVRQNKPARRHWDSRRKSFKTEYHRPFVGRLNIVDLVELLNVDMTRIEKAVEEVMADDPHLHLILGELITE